MRRRAGRRLPWWCRADRDTTRNVLSQLDQTRRTLQDALDPMALTALLWAHTHHRLSPHECHELMIVLRKQFVPHVWRLEDLIEQLR